MKIVKITSLGCPSCIIMNKVINQIKIVSDYLVQQQIGLHIIIGMNFIYLRELLLLINLKIK